MAINEPREFREAKQLSRLGVQLREELCVGDEEERKYKTAIPDGYFDVSNNTAHEISDMLEWQAETNLSTWYYDSEQEEHLPHTKSRWSRWARE